MIGGPVGRDHSILPLSPRGGSFVWLVLVPRSARAVGCPEVGEQAAPEPLLVDYLDHSPWGRGGASVRRQEDDDGLGTGVVDPPRRLDSADAGHPNVQQDEIRAGLGRQDDRCFTGVGRCHELELVGELDGLACRATEGGAVVGEQDPDPGDRLLTKVGL
jgi:hypothetical protein